MSAATATATVDVNNVIDIRRRQLKASAVQFTGKNGAEVVAFVKNAAQNAVNGGSYVRITTDEHGSRALKGDWVVWDVDGKILVLSPEGFQRLFSIKG